MREGRGSPGRGGGGGGRGGEERAPTSAAAGASTQEGERGAGAEKERGRRGSLPRTRPRAAAQSPSPPRPALGRRRGEGSGPGALLARRAGRGGRPGTRRGRADEARPPGGVSCGAREGVGERGSPRGGAEARGPGSRSLRPPGGGSVSRSPAKVPRAAPGNLRAQFREIVFGARRARTARLGRRGTAKSASGVRARTLSAESVLGSARSGSPGGARAGRMSARWSWRIQSGRVGWGCLDPHPRLPRPESRVRA